MTPWMIFDLLPEGPVYDAGKKLRAALQRVPASVATESIPKLRAVARRVEAGEVDITAGLGEWLLSLRTDAGVKKEIETFLAVAQQHQRAVQNALEPLLEDLDDFLE